MIEIFAVAAALAFVGDADFDGVAAELDAESESEGDGEAAELDADFDGVAEESPADDESFELDEQAARAPVASNMLAAPAAIRVRGLMMASFRRG